MYDTGRKDFMWWNELPLSYSNWAKGKPGWENIENCVSINHRGEWINNYCTETLAFICETLETLASDDDEEACCKNDVQSLCNCSENQECNSAIEEKWKTYYYKDFLKKLEKLKVLAAQTQCE